jgi:predicted anti-sigma-YlaC factor YlaD
MSNPPNCKEVARLLSHGLDQELPSAERARLRLHLVICQACRNVEEQMQFLRRAMKQLGRGDEPPGD